MNKGIKNVFECWYDDVDDQKKLAFETDQSETFNFSLKHLTVKGQEEHDKIHTFL